MYDLRPYQKKASDAGVKHLLGRSKKPGVIVAPTGCHGKGELISMADGTKKKVEDICVGDRLIGNDGTNRTVLELHRGVDDMYKIIPIKGNPFIVNGDHIMSLYKTNEGDSPSERPRIDHITVKDYINTSKNYKHLHKLYKPNIVNYDKNNREIILDPYFIGIYLGDGSSADGSISITTMREEIVEYLYEFVKEYNLYVRISEKKGTSNKAKSYFLSGEKCKGCNPITNELRRLGVFKCTAGYKFIPLMYLTSSKENRLKLLAGLLDTDSYYDGSKNTYEYCSKSFVLADQIVTLCRSLGLYAMIGKPKIVNGETYYIILITGDLNNVPTKVGIRKGKERKQKKNNRVTGFSVEYIGKGEYFGFEVDGNHLYCDGQLFVHHNSGKSVIIGDIVKRLNAPTLILQPSKEILEQNYNKAISFGMSPTIYSASCGVKELSELTYATLKSVKKDVERLKQIGIKFLLIDECFTGETEILTNKGFVKFELLKGDEIVAQYDKGNISFVKPKRYIKKHHDGDMVLLHIKNNINIPVTPGHEFLFYSKKTKLFKKERIDEAKFHGEKLIPVSGMSTVEDDGLLSPLERLYIATQADGNIHAVCKNYITVSFSFVKKRKIDRLFLLCKESGTEIYEVKGSKKRRRFMVKMPSDTTRDIRNHIHFPMSSKRANEIINECSLWDGSIISDNMLYYSSKDKSQVDFYNAVASIAGHSCYLSIEKDDRKECFSDIYRLFISKNKKMRSTAFMKKEKISYNGTVYCVEVESGSIVLRHNGYTFVSGNCHMSYSAEEGSEFMKFMKELGDVKTLGFTATPCKLHTYSSMVEGNYSKLNILTKDDPRYFQKIVHVTQIKELVDAGFWSKLKYERWEFDNSALVLNSTGAEYTANSISATIVKIGLNNTIYKRIMQLLNERKHILVAMDSVENCNRISEFMNARMGNITAVVSNETSKKKRENIIEDFKSGKIRVVFNYSALSTGFDFPELDCVILGRPTFSFAYFYQVLGRAVRPHPNKEDALIVDCCDNYSRFGRIEDLSIEEFPGRGWCMFSEDKLISGIPMGHTVMRSELVQQAREKGLLVPAVNEDGRRSHPLDSQIMWFGKYEGIMFKNIPLNYFKFIVEKFDVNSEKIKMIVKYYKEIIL